MLNYEVDPKALVPFPSLGTEFHAWHESADPMTHTEIVSFISDVANLMRGRYQDVILPLTVLRRLDSTTEKGRAYLVDNDLVWPACPVSAGMLLKVPVTPATSAVPRRGARLA
ncbi:MAG: hypothetical protein F4020_00405 [Gammaproteobacteria bacterium]|nr:hypothetical protein [Gammaproteobacteria bacterium]MYK68071.1 hypothetical protein [Gammaproteobacteria bacterium]